MLKKTLLTPALVLLIPVLVVACGDGGEEEPTVTETPAQTEAPATNTPSMTTTPATTPQATAVAGNALGRQTGGATCNALFPQGEPDVGQMVDNVFVCIAEPDPGATVQGTIDVRGFQAGAFEQTVAVQLRGPSGDVIAQTSAIANAPDVGLIVGEWTATLDVPSDAPAGEGTLIAFSASARDGSVDFGGEIPMTIAQ